MNQFEQIQDVERRLLKAMLSRDVRELDVLLSDELLAVGPNGGLVSKVDDLAAHRTGLICIVSMVAQETTIKLLSDIAIVFVLMDMHGSFQSQPFAGRYRYTRVWSNQLGSWQIVAAHISQMPG